MSLHQFLIDRRDDILADAERRTILLAALRPNSAQLRTGLPIFLDQLIAVLDAEIPTIDTSDEIEISDAAKLHGKELLHLGYTLTHVVHSYGAMCQSITEIASKTNAEVSALEFHHLNRCLDIAIAGAVTEFELLHAMDNKNREAIHLGSIAHELRNALNRARISFEVLSKGLAGLGGSTSRVLERSLLDLDRLINRSLFEVRLRADSELSVEEFTVIEIVNHLAVTAEIEASRKKQTLLVEVDPKIVLKTDRHLIIGAIGNLIQNAIKYTAPGGIIVVAAKVGDGFVDIEIRDQCGGISEEKMSKLFVPFVKQTKDKSGLGLGLIIARDSITKCGGTLDVRNAPGGCIFSAKLPVSVDPSEKAFVPVV